MSILRNANSMAVVKFPDAQLQLLIGDCMVPKRESQKRFYSHFYSFAFSVCLRYLPLHDETVNAVNDGFLKVFRELRIFNSRQVCMEDSLKAWMRRIFINTAIDHLRRKKNIPESLPSSHLDIEAPQTGAGSQLSYKELLDLIGRLSPAYRMVFNLFVIDGYGHDEIAEMLGISPGTSKSNLAKARAKLQLMVLAEQEQLKNYERRAV
jgi:RNA polymerase sigma factor (sigma-70 family)